MQDMVLGPEDSSENILTLPKGAYISVWKTNIKRYLGESWVYLGAIGYRE